MINNTCDIMDDLRCLFFFISSFITSICFTCDCCFCLLFNLFYWPMYVFKRFYQLHHIVLLRGWFKQMLEVFFLLRKLLFTILITCQTLYLHLNLYLYYIIFYAYSLYSTIKCFLKHLHTTFSVYFYAFMELSTMRFNPSF